MIVVLDDQLRRLEKLCKQQSIVMNAFIHDESHSSKHTYVKFEDQTSGIFGQKSTNLLSRNPISFPCSRELHFEFLGIAP
jgi:hypothetical protein